MHSSPRPTWRSNLAPALVLAAAVLAVYVNSWSAPFVFDDLPSIVENPTLHSPVSLWRVLSPPGGTGVTVEGRPLLNLSLALNHLWGGEAVTGYHVVNTALHLSCALVLFGLVRRTLEGALGWAQPRLTAFSVALLWALHPLQTESVTYIVQRAESLMSLFYLLTLYCFMRGAQSPRPRRWYAAVLGCSVAGMATKEVMVTAPLLVLLYDRTFVSGDFSTAWRRHRPLYLGLAASWLVLAVLVVGAGNRGGTIGSAAGVSPWEYGLCQARAIIHYLGLSGWPHPLIFDYGSDFVSFGEIVVHGLMDLTLLAATIVALRRAPVLGFIGAWFFLILAPTTSFVGGTRQMLAEHRMYLPLVAPVVLAVAGLKIIAGRRALHIIAGVAAALALTAVARNTDYRSEIALYTDTVAKRPNNPFARYNLGKTLAEQGRFAEAIVQDEAAIKLRPGLASAQNNLAKALVDAGRTAEAIPHYETALQLAPDYAKAHYNLGLALLSLGRKAEALVHFQAAARSDPKDIDARGNWGAVLLDTGDLAGAAEQFRLVIAAAPRVAEAHCNLGTVYLLQGQLDAATTELSQALELDPQLTIARERLALARQQTKGPK
jgi:Flp pilus assembly protein TadD